MRREHGLQAFLLLLIAVDGANVERQVGPGKAADLFKTFAQLQHLNDVRSHDRCGRGGQRDALRAADFFQCLAESQIIRSEVMPPLAETVCLVDGK